MKSIAEGNMEAVKALYAESKGPLPGWGKAQYTPLTAALLTKHPDIAMYMLDQGEAPDQCDHMGKYPIALAVEHGYKDVVAKLIEKGATANLPVSRYRPPPPSLLATALEAGKLEVAVLLMAHGAEVNATDAKGRTPLKLAAKGGYAEMVTALLEKGADVEAVTRPESRSALHIACEAGHPEVVKVLLAKEPALLNLPDSRGRAPLHEAVRGNAADVVAALLEAGAFDSPLDHGGITPLFLATYLKLDPVKHVLVQHGAELRVQDTEISEVTARIVLAEVRGMANALGDWPPKHQPGERDVKSWDDLMTWSDAKLYIPADWPLWQRPGKDIFGRPYLFNEGKQWVVPHPDTMAALREVTDKISLQTGRPFWPWEPALR